MAGKYFNFSDVLGYGWRVMKSNFWFVVGVGLTFFIITYLPTILRAVVERLYLPTVIRIPLSLSLTLVGWVIGIILSIGLIKISLSFCDEQRPEFVTLFDARGCFWRYVGAAILYGLIVLTGFILLIVPGIIWAVKFGLCFYFVVDKGLGPIEALKASSRTTMGVKWQLFGFAVICGLITLLGLLCLIVGIFAAYPTVIIAKVLLYRQLSAQTPELAEFGICVPPPRLDTQCCSSKQEF